MKTEIGNGTVTMTTADFAALVERIIQLEEQERRASLYYSAYTSETEKNKELSDKINELEGKLAEQEDTF